MKKIISLLVIVPLSILSMLTIMYLFTRDEPLFSLKNIKINGVHQLQTMELMGRIAPFLKESLFKMDVTQMREAITSHPFIREVRITRVYPFSLVIDVKEKTPSALWVRNTGEVQVLDEYGEPYRPLGKGAVKGLYIINAREKNDMQSVFHQVNRWFSEGIIPREIVSEVTYVEGNITIFGADDGIEIILGKEDQKGRLKRAMAVLEDAKRRGFLIKCIDARFEKGAIVRERKG